MFAVPLCARLFICGWERADLLARLWCPTVSLSLSHWYPGSGVVLLIVSIPDLCTLTYVARSGVMTDDVTNRHEYS